MFWGHANIGYSPKPDIVIHEDKDPSFSITDKHFERLIKVYGAPIKILNLVKKESKNEQKLGHVYEKYMKDVQTQPKKFIKNRVDLTCEWFDFFKIYNSNEAELLTHMQQYGTSYIKDIRPTLLDFTIGALGVNYLNEASDQFSGRCSTSQLCGLLG